MIFSLRELTSKEFEDVCLNNSRDHFSIINPKLNFTLRIYSSGCYYLDQYNNWQSDGLLVILKVYLIQIRNKINFRLDKKPIFIKHNVLQIIFKKKIIINDIQLGITDE